ncbi:MAG: ABC transporter permease [Dongiaceae bacterium]
MSAADAPRPGLGRSLPPPSALGLLGLAVVLAIVLAALLAPWLAPHSPTRLLGTPFQPPGRFPLGTDVIGRDLLSRLLYASRLTLLVTFAATTIGFLAGAAWGFAAAEIGGVLDDLTDWLVNILLSVPPLMLGLLVVAALTSDLAVLVGVIAFIQMPRVVRVARAVAVDITALQFVEVARARGEGLWSILRREVLPNAVRPLGVEYGLRLTYSTLFISGLSFLGLGIQPPEADWGGMVRENLSSIQEGAYLPTLLPALAIGAFGVALNLVVDWLGERSARTIPEDLR